MPKYGAIDGETRQVTPSGATVLITTKPCCVCGTTHFFELDAEAYDAWQTNTKIQDAFPELSVADREILISGTCDECFHKLFSSED